MDCGADYIKMCEKAVEVQKEWKKLTGNCFFDYRSSENPICYCGYCMGEGGEYDVLDPEFIVWLPRQDQLQDMLNDLEPYTPNNFLRLLDNFNSFWKDYIVENNKAVYYSGLFKSMEQLWLAFVMKERWNKTWDGEEWKN